MTPQPPARSDAVSYLRVSSMGQVETDYNPEGISIPAQREATDRKAAELGAKIVGEYIEPGRTATSIAKRPTFQEMLARIKAALRRSGTPASAALSVGSIRLHPERHEVTLPDGEIARLTPLEFRLLHILMRNRGQVMSADQLVEHVWGHEEHVGDRILLKGLIRRLRQKVDLDPARPSLIKTVAGVGYSFVP